MKQGIKIFFLLLFIGISFSEKGICQSTFFSFKVPKSGIYKITEAEARKLGANSLDEISIAGFPGMLPQKLDPEQFELQEIPSQINGDAKFFYLEGPNSFAWEDEKWNYQHHLFEDSLSYLIGIGKKGTTISSIELPEEDSASKLVYKHKHDKGEENNILNSGRIWYSEPIFPGSSRTISVFRESGSNSNWKVFGKIMASAKASSEISLLADDQVISKTAFDALPNSTYGIKGREELLEKEFNTQETKLDRLRISFQTSDLNASAYWDHISVAIPYQSTELDTGIYYNWSMESFSALPKNGLSYWDISDFYEPIAIQNSLGFSTQSRKIAVFNPSAVEEIKTFEPLTLSPFSASSSPALLIITTREFSFAAEKLRNHKNSLGISSEIAYLSDIYSAFGYGNKDINAIRNFIAAKYQYGKSLKNVLILGKGTFDYKNKFGGRPNIIPIYTSRNSLNPLTTFSSDDFYGLIDLGQGYWEESREGDELMQIGVGRLPVINTQEALIVVNKIIDYETSLKPGLWKESISWLVDDGDNGIHMRDAEALSENIRKSAPEIIQEKLYLDRYEQESTAQNQKSPEASAALLKALEKGKLLINYIGHGNETTLAAEEILQVSDISDWPKQDNLAIWVTATCEFGRQDSPFVRSSAEELLVAEGKGAIALLTTGRPVFSSVNFSLNDAFSKEVFKLVGGNYQDLGTIFKNTKNNSLNGSLNRNFSLIGDPSLRLAKPELEIKITSITDENGSSLETLPIGEEVILEGKIIDPLPGSKLIGYEGNYTLEIYYQEVEEKTLGDENSPFEFEEENTVLFRGEGIISEGNLKSTFIIPSHLEEEEFQGKIRIIGSDPSLELEAFGFHSLDFKRGIQEVLDQNGPLISVLLNGQSPNSSSFPSKSLSALINLEDESGIDISGLIPNQSIQIQVNGEERIILNEFFKAEEGNYKKGNLEFLLTGLNEGKNQISIEAWDNLGNQSILTLEIQVKGSETLKILNHKTYPNPTNSVSNFEIEHNRPGENFQITFSVYQTTGQTIFEQTFRLVKAPARIDDLSWIFFQNQTKYPAKGTYIYKLTLQAESDNAYATASGQIVIK
ncbi:type IX secretion system sortase PorU [Algoriphagus pacificus]|uniref:Type IX secretion system sortase PorU n=1 Tax=Algoriphagus pacificus TaxID=2811234 RepID=A0ABS3CEA5_9BACT|nr:type IX secretion system sortase PorU [Algoriphagus pacificus]MBN7815437.1 type IX secretion system sortase PorU [Algoriphagus pacificus]